MSRNARGGVAAPRPESESGDEGVRLNKALADAGLCSRRKADALVFSGAVKVNGQRADSPGLRVCPGRDRIEVNGRPVSLRRAGDGRSGRCWLMLHKPAGVVATARDPEGRRTVLDLVPPPWNERRLYPVGRLDFFSEGLLLITDDGQLAHRLSHPRWHLPRVYDVRVRPESGAVALPRALEIMRGGMTLAEGERLAPVQVEVWDAADKARPGRGSDLVLRLTLHQGLNRQIRRMCRDLGLTVLRLRRVAQGPLRLGDLPAGRIRPLRGDELAALRRAVGL